MLRVVPLLLLSVTAVAEEKIDLGIVYKIKDEAFRRSQVMDNLFWLTDANGPRLTGSPGLRHAAEWAVGALKGWGAAKATLETWGTFGRGWTMSHWSATLVAPAYAQLQALPLAWSGATNGPVTGDVVLAPLLGPEDEADTRDMARLKQRIERYMNEHRGKLRGKVVLLDPARDLDLPSRPVSTRYDEPKLAEESAAEPPLVPVPWTWPLSSTPVDEKKREALYASMPLEVAADWWDQQDRAYWPLYKFFTDEGVAAVLSIGRGGGGLIFAESLGAAWDPAAPAPPAVLVVEPGAYNRLARFVDKKVAAKVTVDVSAKLLDDSKEGYNVVAELPGTGKKKDEIVMIGAHLDSWHAGTGATDNGAGCAVVLETFRILKALNLPLDRTVRLALWTGEEQALYGSRGYVKNHFADPVTMVLKPEHAKLAAYFNLDNGTGKVRGVWLQGNDMVRPIFDAWLGPFKDEGATTLSIRDTGGTDHQSFDAVGLPGFQFIQDPLDYGTRTHHSNLDVYDHAQPSDLMQASAVMAWFVYEAANRPEMLPRKPLPKKLPPRTK